MTRDYMCLCLWLWIQYFHLPYSFVECDQMAFEFWTITEVSDQFQIPAPPAPAPSPSDRCC